MIVPSLIDDFLKHLEQYASPLTIRNYNHWLKEFLAFAGDIEPQKINIELIKKYKIHLAKKHLKKVTQNYFLIALRSFLRFLASLRINSLSFEEVNLTQTEVPAQKALDEEERQQLLEAPDISKKQGLRDRAILETLYSTGLKVSQLVKLNRSGASSIKPLFIRFQGKKDLANHGESMRLTPRSIQRIVEKYAKKINLGVKATPEILRRSKH